ncbi:MAG: S1 RNA-binding domain-containing protein [Nanoarchaeota archaeon]|nr:S1 RNA-binding domain-containing protein [Nanoarchaeota archaeon]
MFYKKKGFPEVGELVMCTVKKVLFHSVFVYLDEYASAEGMLHISEVAPGRIRNIRDYVKEDKKIICKILKIDKEKRHIDLSLRRVNLSQKRNKNDEYKQEQKAEKLLEGVGGKLKLSIAEMYHKAGYAMIEEFERLGECFYAIVADEVDLVKELKIDPKIAGEIVKVVKEKIKPVRCTASGIISVSCSASDGVERVKKVLKGMSEFKGYDAKITYTGAPRYSISVIADDYKTVDVRIAEITGFGEEMAKKLGCEISFKKDK